MSYPDHLLVNYFIKPGHIAEVISTISIILDELEEKGFDDIFYSVYQIGVSGFIHLQCFPNEEVSKQVFSLPSFREFFDKLESICEQEPIANDVQNIGYYNSLRQ